MEDSITLDELLEKRCDKLQCLEITTVLFKSKDAVKEDLFKISTNVTQISDGVNELREELNKMRDQNNQCRELLLMIQELNNKIVHMEKNIPPQLIRSFNDGENELGSVLKEILSINEEVAVESDVKIQKKTPVKDCRQVLYKEPDVYPTIRLITQDEFNTIPKYIIGRQSLDAVNSLINSINQILKAKYTLLAMGKVHARKQDNISLYLHYKKQDLDICTDNEYIYFFTDEDYELHTKTKLNRTKLNLITVLRHCKRLREHRARNNLRYVVIID
ncbi:SKA complex subunit 1 [Nomia melanderi]|uniref:SKA complex subunit 1 n=1 Tax=Nomia melanderi TaxID=2448451 RepID=UPI001304284F|nr:spindle and kinetochore-associated protein 1-like [Nomia melanderi]XP_031829817.1 spindle and kinetochore-associated protein 1-like [Nomia melanderi]